MNQLQILNGSNDGERDGEKWRRQERMPRMGLPQFMVSTRITSLPKTIAKLQIEGSTIADPRNFKTRPQ